MKRTLLITTLAFLLNADLLAQSVDGNRLMFALEPNIMPGSIKYLPEDRSKAFLIKNQPALGLGFNIIYQKRIIDNLFANIGCRMLILRRTVDLQIDKSGFNDKSSIKYDRLSGKNASEYFTGAGITAGLCHTYQLRKNFISLSAGIHFDFPILPSIDNSFFMNTGTRLEGVYFEDFSKANSFRSVYIGADFSVLYHFALSNDRSVFLGVSAGIDPNQKINGDFIVYPSLAVSNNGTFSVSKNYVALSMGGSIPVRKKRYK